MLGISPLAIDNLVTAVVWAVLWGMYISLPVVPQQSRLVAYAPSASAVLLGLNSSAIYVSIAIGGALGGLLHEQLTAPRLGLLAAAISVVGLILNLTTSSRRFAPRRPKAAESAR